MPSFGVGLPGQVRSRQMSQGHHLVRTLTLVSCGIPSAFVSYSNTMDSTMGSEPRRRGVLASAVKRQHGATLCQEGLGDCEGSETEEGNMTPCHTQAAAQGTQGTGEQ
ncbi:hypothetical protein GWK47_006624 [Chionoecetes opilio]|uniref:Uncharacterized protein n=1 Tax=Chionoecetes opilio TaxID=41210 RepID=A0A8J4Y525_CHIOP|nr:hypothetical protein GWK47_006624 [Chionoecetes opilio]